MTLASVILSRFRGRSDIVAVQNGDGFKPHQLNGKPMQPEWLEARHLSGTQCLGFYLLDKDNTVCCTAVDFDNKPDNPDPQWKEKAEKIYYELSRAEMSPLVEVSQSGNAAHVWLFFEQPTPAWIVRQWWALFSKHVNIEFREVYPRQDALTGKGLGNLIRYPLWGKSGFVDVENEWAAIDPMAALSGVRTITGAGLSLLAHELGIGEIKEPAATISSGVDGGVSVRVTKLIGRSNSLLSRRWNGDTSGLKDVSRSALCMSIATELVRLYVPTLEIEMALKAWCEKVGLEKGERDDWIPRTVTKAYEFITNKTEKLSVSSTTFRDACMSYIDIIEQGQTYYLPSGIAALDESIDGIAPGEVCILAARPSHGKSAFAFQWLDSVAKQGTPCLIISEEMSAIEIGKRRLCAVSGLDQSQWSPETAAMLRQDVDAFYQKRAAVHVVEGCNTIERAEEVIDQFCGIHSVSFVAVDYMQLLTSRQESRYEIVTDISRKLKQAARRNGCAMLVLSQLNREVDKRPGRQPKLSDIRESGQVEQDADLVLFAQHPRKYDPKIPASEYCIFAAKRRNGPIRQDKIQIVFDLERQTFT